MIDKDYIKANLTMAQVLDYYGISYPSGKQIDIICPFHEDSKPSCSINMVKNIFFCHGCGKKGSVIDFVKHKEDSCSFKDACDRIEQVFFSGQVIDKFYTQTPTRQVKVTRKDYSVSWKSREIYACLADISGLTETGRNYLMNERGFSKATIERFGLLSIDNVKEIWEKLQELYSKEDLDAAGLADNWGNFIFKDSGILIPYYNGDDIVYYEFRYYQENDNKRYSCLKGRDKAYFTGRLKPGKVYVFEGVFDAMSFNQLFVEENILGGGGIPALQEVKIKDYLEQMGMDAEREFCYLPDDDNNGKALVIKLRQEGKSAYTLPELCGMFRLEFKDAKDWNELLLRRES
ncbi:MAG: toprim domain-containing protein [Candidatus Cloacimonetes bacterium]|nr:toprim domain-containing protein [Candidatus Cloacimonadota bacterium]